MQARSRFVHCRRLEGNCKFPQLVTETTVTLSAEPMHVSVRNIYECTDGKGNMPSLLPLECPSTCPYPYNLALTQS